MFKSSISYVLITLTILMIMSNAATMKKDKSILYSRIAIQGLIIITYIAYSGLFIKPLDKGIGIYNSLFNITIFSQSFNIFIMVLGAIICILNAFYPRTLEGISSNFTGVKKNDKDNLLSENQYNMNNEDKELLLNKDSSQYTIIEYALIMIFVLCGAVFLMSTGDLISLFLSIELQSYGLYILATLYRNSESATGSGLTYFLLGGLSSCFILLGSAILYVNSGTTDLDNLYIINTINEFTGYTLGSVSENNIDTLSSLSWGELYVSNYINFSLIVLTVGFLFKVSAAPFHFWSPDVYDGIPTVVTTFVAIIAKISIFILMLELVSYMETTQLMHADTIQFLSWKNILIISSLMSLIIGSVLGLTQYRIKRLFAYSTISHVGFILLALSVNSMESIQGYIFYILQYSLSNLNAFFILVTIGYTLYLYQYKTNISGENSTSYVEDESKFIDIKNSPVQLLSQIKGYFHINSFLAISLAITLFSFVGIPPLIGFFAKQMVLSAALDKGYVFMTLVGIITSVIGAVYYLNIIKLLFFSKSDYSKVNELISVNVFTKSSNKVSIYINSILSMTVTILTMTILLFIFMPDEWFRIVSILSLSLSNF